MSHIELKGKFKETVYDGGVRQVVQVTEIYIDGLYSQSYGMENKFLLPTYHSKVLQAKQYRPLLDVIINLARPITKFRGSCDVTSEVLEYLAGVSRWTVADGLKHLQTNDFIIYSTNTGRSASYHIEIVLQDKKENEINNGLVIFMPDNQYVSTAVTESETELLNWLNIKEIVANGNSLQRIVANGNSLDADDKKTVAKSHSSPDETTVGDGNNSPETVGDDNSLDLNSSKQPQISDKLGEVPTKNEQNAYINSVSIFKDKDIIDSNKITVSPTEHPAGKIESPFFNPIDNRALPVEEIEGLRTWQKDIIKLFKEWTGRDFGENDLKELNKAYSICEPWQIKNAMNFAGQKRGDALNGGGMRYVMSLLAKGMFNKRRVSKTGDVASKDKKLEAMKKEFEDITYR